jgi:hypothetical protein
MPEWILQVVSIVAAGAGVYAAIRADLAFLRAKVDTLEESAERAHRRIDGLITKGG